MHPRFAFAKPGLLASMRPMFEGDRRVAWLRTGQDGLAAMLAAIVAARRSVGLEIYVFEDGAIGRRFREALTDAAARGVRVRVLVDTFGSIELPADYFRSVTEAGGDCRWFNPLELGRFTYRDHRKLLVVDEEVAFVAGFNIGDHYDGDGIQRGWRDVGVVLRGPPVPALSKMFHAMFGAAGFRHRLLSRFRRQLVPQRLEAGDADLFLLSPGRERNPARETLVDDVLKAQRIRLTTAYFLPPRRLRQALCRAARSGTQVQLILPGRSDVAISQWAARGLYSGLLRAGVEIYEYQPTVLHAKRYLIDDRVYVGSANLDLRSLNINYELLIRFSDPTLAREGHRQFDEDLALCRRIQPREWRSRGLWQKIRERLASFFLVRLDARFAVRHLHRLREGRVGLKSGRRKAL